MALPKNTTPDLSFDWQVYADATFAGLSILIPIPLLDVAFEQFFRRRMPVVIARRNGLTLSPSLRMDLNRGRFSCLVACLTWPVLGLIMVLKRLSRNLLYFLTIKESSDQLSLYWHRAFLLDYMCEAGYLADEATAVPAAEALRETLDTIPTSPVNELARQVVYLPHHLLRTLRQARRGQMDAEMEKARSLMARTWDSFGDHFLEVARRYDDIFQQVQARLQAEAEQKAPPKG
ncbi:MAG: hypothetical protein H6659_17700 [Ardenticatenaceae bacterium]|nr:hypothetical protein [Ardenticatenaceae bacterium]MCB8988312.1 hypothetical protein [Ardenticatenaceae bacterium]